MINQASIEALYESCPAPVPADEAERMAALIGLDILDSPPEAEFDALVRAASLACGVKISLITLVDAERQWFKANTGLPGLAETPRDVSFCSHTILEDDLLEVPDAWSDPRFADNPLVSGQPGIRFYCGAPLRVGSGSAVGTLCVIDYQPRVLTEDQKEVLRALSKAAARALEGRQAMLGVKQNAAKLMTSEARLRALSDGAPNGIFHTDASGSFVYTNQRLREILNLEPKQSLGEGWTRVLHACDRDDVVEQWRQAVRAGSLFHVNCRILRADGRSRLVRVDARPVMASDGAVMGFVGSVEDDTERHLTLQRLVASEDRLRRLYEATPTMLQYTDPQGRILMISDTWLTKLGYARKDVIERDALDFMTAEARQTLMNLGWPQLRATERCENVDCQMVAKSGDILDMRLSTFVDYDAEGCLAGSLTMTEDMTLHRRAETAMRDSEARYRMLADATSDVIMLLDLALVGRYVSPACRATLGYAPEALTGQPLETFIHADDAPHVRAVVQDLLTARKGDKATTTYRMRHAQGQWVWIEAGLNLVRDPDSGQASSLICSLRDVGERQRVTHHLEEAKVAAERAARIKADFMANMSHELRTPLTGILGIHDLLRNDPTLAPVQKHYVELARDAGRSLLAIVNDVLDFSKIEAGQLSIEQIAFDLDGLIGACRDFGREAAKTKVLEVVSERQGPPLTLIGDPNRLRQILLNFLSNAVKFSERGRVVIRADYSPEPGRLRVAVSDTGIGIAEDKLAILFKRFSQADQTITRSYGGTGLGLAICKSLVELMGGEIGVESALGSGSTFWFEVPLQAVPEQARPDSQDLTLVSMQARRVLLAEDVAVNQEIIAAMLRQRGHEVTVVNDGAEAVRMAARGTFDIILLDLHMPVMDGLSAARAIRAAEASNRQGAVPIVGLTANAMPQDVEHCYAVGMDAHVAKPIAWGELFSMIDRLAPVPWDARRRTAIDEPVLDEKKLAELAGFIGRERLAKMLGLFVIEVERRVADLHAADFEELSARIHSLISLAGHFGFTELSRLCADIADELREEDLAMLRGRQSERIEVLRAAASRAVTAAQACDYLKAA